MSRDDNVNSEINVKNNIVTIVTSNPYQSQWNQIPAAVNTFPKMKHLPSSLGPIINLLKTSHGTGQSITQAEIPHVLEHCC